MTVYVDDMYKSPMGVHGRMKMSHMIADSTEELLLFAVLIGLHPRWLQKAGTPYEHFDVSMTLRAKAVENGAKEISMRELALKCRNRRSV